jgi:long-chain acyl-CoA synthetase
MFVALLKLPSAVRNRYDLSSLRYVLHGGAPCPVAVKKAMLDWLGPIIWESYGATEVQGAAVSPQDWLKHPGTVGKPILGTRIKILGEAGEECGPNEVGRVFMTPYTGDRFEYHGDPDKTRRSYNGDYIFVGDMGYLDDEGNLFLCGRESELILSSGMNIYPREIEDALIQHPSVTDCAVVGVPHPLCGEVPKAFVVLASDAAPEMELRVSLLQLLARHVSASKMPKRFEFVRQIPRDPNGKLFRRKLIQ